MPTISIAVLLAAALDMAAERERLRRINAKLLEALRYAVDNSEFSSEEFDRRARAAIARAESFLTKADRRESDRRNHDHKE